MTDEPYRITATELKHFYTKGAFPMVEGDVIHLHAPDPRAVFPLAKLRPPNARLLRYFRNNGYSCTMDTAFEEVMRACADRPDRWMNEELLQAYVGLFHMGHATSVEVWQAGGLIGGIYGVKLRRAFFGESMFSRRPNASKAAFHHLVDHLRANNFTLFDTQYINDHTRSLGAVEMPQEEFQRLLREALG